MGNKISNEAAQIGVTLSEAKGLTDILEILHFDQNDVTYFKVTLSS